VVDGVEYEFGAMANVADRDRIAVWVWFGHCIFGALLAKRLEPIPATTLPTPLDCQRSRPMLPAIVLPGA
jgi:hypothetical protein